MTKFLNQIQICNMCRTIVEAPPIFTFKLKPHPNNDHVCNQRITEGSCPMTGPDGYAPFAGKLNLGGAACSNTIGLPLSPCGSGINVDPHDKFCNFILKMREPIADYLEKHGFPKNSQCSFLLLVTSLVQRSYNALLTITTMLVNLFPLLDGFVYLIRFILDKIIEICYTTDRAEKVLKGLLFLGELAVLFIIVMAIFGLILMPVFSLLSYVIRKCICFAVPS